MGKVNNEPKVTARKVAELGWNPGCRSSVPATAMEGRREAIW